jgi:hypothetical protein
LARSTDAARRWDLVNVIRPLLWPKDFLVDPHESTATLTADRQFSPDGVGLYRSTDAARRWDLVNVIRPLLWPKDFLVDPHDSRIIYIGAADARAAQAGLWRSRDGGASWQRLAKQGSEHFGAFVHPARKGWIYMTLTEGAPGAGLWLSEDDGRS